MTPLPTPRAVLFDLDFTLLEPGDLFFAEGYRRTGEKFGLDLDVARWPEAEGAAYRAVEERRRQFGNAHDDGTYDAIALAVITALGGGDREKVQVCAEAVIAEWARCENFTLYADVVPCLARLRAAGIRMALVSNTNRDLAEVLDHFALREYVTIAVASCEIGLSKPAPEIFAAALDGLGVPASRAAMVGDSLSDDVRGALECGFAAAVLLDRSGRPSRHDPTIRSLVELPALLGL